MNGQLKVNCLNEYDTLKDVIVVQPKFMKITDVINTTQRHYVAENINTKLALEQHKQFIKTLKDENINVIQLDSQKKLNEQVFTRDIGFTIGDTLFIAKLNKEIRKQEKEVLINWLQDNHIPYHPIHVDSIEGGDVLVDNGRVWVGLSKRTTLQAVRYLQSQLRDFKVYPIPIHDDILHLDCTLNFISNDTALIFKPGISDDAYNEIKKHFKIIEVTKEEQFHLGPNVLSVGNKKIISLSSNKRLNKILEKHGYNVLEVDFSEIIKSGGSFRCCTLPLHRN